MVALLVRVCRTNDSSWLFAQFVDLPLERPRHVEGHACRMARAEKRDGKHFDNLDLGPQQFVLATQGLDFVLCFQQQVFHAFSLVEWFPLSAVALVMRPPSAAAKARASLSSPASCRRCRETGRRWCPPPRSPRRVRRESNLRTWAVWLQP